MFKLLVITALVTLGAAGPLDGFTGEWKIAKVWPKVHDHTRSCTSCQITDTNDLTKCGDKEFSFVDIDQGNGRKYKAPATVVHTHEEVEEALKTKCENHQSGLYVIHRLDDNYASLNLKSPSGILMTILLSRTIPDEAALNEFVSKTHGLKEREGATICTSRISPARSL